MLSGKTLLITAGPTWEAIDPVRGITNHSSGKMGYALASVAAELGAKVSLISGPVCLAPPKGVETKLIQSAQQMYDVVHQTLGSIKVDIFIGVAAVADYRPIEAETQKIKKSAEQITITLTKNPDIVASVASLKQERPFTVGFAAETEHLEQHARTKLEAKNLDMIIANDVCEQGIGFGADQNRALMLTKKQQLDLGKHDKVALAKIILFQVSNHLQN